MEVSFHSLKEEACKRISYKLNQLLEEKTYKATQVPLWVNEICDESLNALKNLNPNFKYIVNCLISEIAGTEVQSASFYTPCDANCLVKWKNDHMQVFVNVFAVAL